MSAGHIESAAAMPPERVPAIVISPHLDDGVLGCGHWLAAHPGSIVLTVFAGRPADGAQQTDWDRRCGFSDAAQAVEARRFEDVQALAALRARPQWLEFADSQYTHRVQAHAVARAIETALCGLAPALLLYPLGLFHTDHLLVHAATRLMLADHPAPPPALAYEDALYRGMPGLLQRRLLALAQQNIVATPARMQAPRWLMRAKDAAMQAYVSQRRAFGPGGWDDAAQPERFWRLDGQTEHAEADGAG